ncbi:esterase-like activity of phytase family protein [Rhodovulum strictum]|uniref:esterase-like activity of phytase family protein n=1 Tax=Rhodovulum strictum TaxID=58314 RepID=UPI00129B1811
MPKRPGRRLIAFIAGLILALPALADEAVHVATLGIPKAPDFVGLSGIDLSPDGERFVAISDRGWFLTGRIEREDGRPVAFQPDGPRVFMLNMQGHRMRSHERDAEGLAVAPDGRVFVSFEVFHRVRSWRDIHEPATWMPDLPDIDRLRPNSGIEALALGPDGALYALPEALVDAAGVPVYRFPLPPPQIRSDGTPADHYASTRWSRAFSLPARGRFRPVGADFGPDGRFYLLERDFMAPIGFRSRVRRFEIGPDGPRDETVLLETPVGRHGNLEGISVWQDDAGAIRLTMVADDNGLALQRNELVEYRVVSSAAEG